MSYNTIAVLYDIVFIDKTLRYPRCTDTSWLNRLLF